jgi:flagellar motor switch protein FliN/FliY
MSEQATDLNSAGEQGDDRAAAMAEQGAAESAATEEGGAEKAGYEKAEFDDLASQPVAQGAGEANLDVILDIPVTLSMEIGRTEITINDLLQLGQGSVVELGRLAGEPMDVMVNGTLIAHGEVVVVDEKFGIRLTDVISPTERIKKLK